jgi:hypothetical protein
MLRDLVEVKEAIREGCMEAGLKSYKVLNPCELLGLSGDMEDDDLARLMGEDSTHMLDAGYVALAEKLCKIVEDEKISFQGEKRQREKEPEMPEGDEVGSHRRRYVEWLFFTVSGEGRWNEFRLTRGGGRGGRGGRGGGTGPREDRRDGYGRGRGAEGSLDHRLGPRLYRD